MKKLTKKGKVTLTEKIIAESNISELIHVVYVGSVNVEQSSKASTFELDNKEGDKSRIITMETLKVNAKYNKNSDNAKFVKDLNIDLDAEFMSMLTHAAETQLAKIVLDRIEEMADTAHKEDYNTLDKFKSFLLEKIFKKSYTKLLKIKSYEDLSFNIRKYLSKISRNQASVPYINAEYKKFAISNFLTTTHLKNSPNIILQPLEGNTPFPSFRAIVKEGILDGDKAIYTNSYASNTEKTSEVLVGYKTHSADDGGLALFIYSNGTDITKEETENEVIMYLTLRCAIVDMGYPSSKLYHKFAFKSLSL